MPRTRKDLYRNLRTHGFTLIELLVVVAIIVVLIAILVPALTTAMAAAQKSTCATQVRALAQSGVKWSIENKGRFPNANTSKYETPYHERSWIGDEIGRRPDHVYTSNSFSGTSGSLYVEGQYDGWYTTDPTYNTGDPGIGDPTDPEYGGPNPTGPSADPRFRGSTSTETSHAGTAIFHPEVEGVLVPLLGGRDHAKKIYRCPSLEMGALGSGRGSNGLFDYALNAAFKGATAANIPATTKYRFVKGSNSDWTTLPTPLFIEEDPAFRINADYPDSQWCNDDGVSRTHKKSGNVASTDGSVHSLDTPGAVPFNESWRGITATADFRIRLPSGRESGFIDWGFMAWDGL